MSTLRCDAPTTSKNRVGGRCKNSVGCTIPSHVAWRASIGPSADEPPRVSAAPSPDDQAAVIAAFQAVNIREGIAAPTARERALAQRAWHDGEAAKRDWAQPERLVLSPLDRLSVTLRSCTARLFSASDWGPGWAPPASASPVSTAGVTFANAVEAETAALFGLDAYWGWQRHLMSTVLDTAPDGRTQYTTVVVIICRQNGKTTALYPLFASFLALGDQVLFTLHERKLALEKFLECASALKRAAPGRYSVSRKQGSERVTDLETGGRVVLATPDDAGGRSMTADRIVVDEAAHIRPEFLRAARGTLLTRPDAQTILISSGMVESSHDLAAARDAAYRDLLADAAERRHGILEWSAKTTPGVGDVDVADEQVWARCIPTLGLPGGASVEQLRDFVASTPRDDFAREYLSIPTGSPLAAPITPAMWDAARSDDDTLDVAGLKNRIVAVDTSPHQAHTSIVVAGMDGDTVRAAVLAADAGDDWLEDELLAACRAVRPLHVIADARSPASHVADRLAAAGWEMLLTSAQEMARSCAGLLSLLSADPPGLQAVPDDALTAAACGAVKRWIADVGWAFDRRDGSGLDITPVVALALAAQRSWAEPR